MSISQTLSFFCLKPNNKVNKTELFGIYTVGQRKESSGTVPNVDAASLIYLSAKPSHDILSQSVTMITSYSC